MYEFSVPMPYSKEHLDKLIQINNEIEKSKITSLYFSLPTNSIDFTGFEQDRYNWDFETDFDYWKKLIDYSLKNNFDFIYILNSPVVHYEGSDDLYIKLEKLDKLLNKLRNTGCNKVRISNPQLMGYINEKHPDFELYISTSLELKTIKDYINLFSTFKNIKECVPSWDVNKNFRLLKNLQKKFPEIKLELMVNEGCSPACPFRYIHYSWANDEKKANNCYYSFSVDFYKDRCSLKRKNNLAEYLCNTNIIYPWEIEEYSKIGINKFKLVGRNAPEFRNGKYFDYYEYYLKGVDNIKHIENIPIRYFNNYISNSNNINFLVKDIKNYLPDIKHFMKKGHLCSSLCGNECRYCYKCAEKIKTELDKVRENKLDTNLKFCYIDNSLFLQTKI